MRPMALAQLLFFLMVLVYLRPDLFLEVGVTLAAKVNTFTLHQSGSALTGDQGCLTHCK